MRKWLLSTTMACGIAIGGCSTTQVTSFLAQVQADAELRDLFVPALRGDISIVETYLAPETPPLACPISAFRGDQDRMVTSESVEAWQYQTHGRFRSRTVPGSHLFLQTARDQIQKAIVQDLQTSLVSLPE